MARLFISAAFSVVSLVFEVSVTKFQLNNIIICIIKCFYESLFLTTRLDTRLEMGGMNNKGYLITLLSFPLTFM
jgi:hypothetical protein